MLRQGHRRWPARRRLRRPGRRHGRARPARPRVPGRHLSGNPLATAAGLAVLDLLDADAYAAHRVAGRLPRRRPGRRASPPPGITAVVPRWGSLVGLFFGADRPARLRRRPAPPTRPLYAAFFHALLDRGVAIAPGAYEVMFPGLAHADAVLDRHRRGRRRAPRPWPHPPSSTPPTATGPRRRGGPVPDDLEQAAIDTDALVLFGATGDLAAQEDLPGHLPRSSARGRLGHARRRRGVLGVGRRRAAGHARRASRSPSTADLDTRRGRRLREPAQLRQRRLPRPRRPTTILRRAASAACSHPLFYLAIPPVALRRRRAGPRAGRPHRGRQGRGREALRPRPRDSARAQRRAAPSLPRVVGVPHRPLPRQGRHREPAGVPLRQLAARAGLEPQLHLEHPDHDGRGLRHRRPGQVLRHRRRAPRRRAEPPARDRGPARPWSRRSPPTPTRCATRR